MTGDIFTILTLASSDDGPPVPVNSGGPGTAGGDGASTGQSSDAKPVPQNQGSGFEMLFPLILIFVIFWVLMIVPQRREKKKRATMMSSLKKGDRVQTVGGILGTIVDLKEHEVIVKVDETTNTRMHFTRGAIHSVLSDAKAAE